MRQDEYEVTMFKTKSGKYVLDEEREDIVSEERMTVAYTYEPSEKRTFDSPGYNAVIEIFALFDFEDNEIPRSDYDLEELQEKYSERILLHEIDCEENAKDTGDDDYHRLKEEFELDKEQGLDYK